MIYGIIDTVAHRLTLAQAGLPPPIVVRTGGEVSLEGSGGFPVGLIEGMAYENEVITCGPGDRVFFYSDGITECFNPSGEQFSADRLITVLEKSRSGTLAESLRTAEEALLNWRGSMDFDDDVTMLALEIE
jgi:sigma-B regulation protein RsbU (phosphoserine phosphatase)